MKLEAPAEAITIPIGLHRFASISLSIDSSPLFISLSCKEQGEKITLELSASNARDLGRYLLLYAKRIEEARSRRMKAARS